MAPILCLLIVFAIAFLQYRNVTALRGEMDKADAEIAVVDRKLKEPPTGQASTRIAAVGLTPQEQPTFVNWLRETAVASHVEVSKYTSMAAPPPPAATAPDQPKDPNAPKPLPRGIAPLISAVEVSGTYADIRDFLDRKSTRLNSSH